LLTFREPARALQKTSILGWFDQAAGAATHPGYPKRHAL